MEELKACGTCGGTAKITREEWKPYRLATGLYSFQAVCTNCGKSGGKGITGKNIGNGETITEEAARQIAVKKWNEM